MAESTPIFHAESMCAPGDNNTTLVSVQRPMPCVVIFVHGVNSEGEWYENAERGLVDGLNDRLGRTDLKRNVYSEDGRTILALKNSPVIRFYWGYRAPESETITGTFRYKIPLMKREGSPGSYTYPPYSFKSPGTCVKGTYYWGGGPFQNGTTALNMSWHKGFDPKVLGGIDIGSPHINPERDRPLNEAPKRTYYVNASKRLAELIDTIYEWYPDDTVAVVSHSQGTMVAALAMLYVERVPDTLFLCNSPYCFEDKVIDGVTMGNEAPTARSRVRTFFNILDLFKASQSDSARKTTEKQLEGVGGWLNIRTQERTDGQAASTAGEADGPGNDPASSTECEPGARMKWSPSVPTEQPVPGQEDHRNHGRLFVYCSPHDRVMGSTPLKSIGWKGVDYWLPDPNTPQGKIEPFKKYAGVLFQRQFMRAYPVGGAPDQGDGPRTPRHPTDGRPLWIPPSPKVAGLIDEMASIGKDEKIYVNGPRVPDPMSADLMYDFNDDLDPDPNKREKLSETKDFKYYKELLYEKLKWVDDEPNPYDKRPRRRRQTDAEIKHELDTTDAIPTNHSTIFAYRRGELAKRILAYDLPIGRADSFSNRPFWKQLIKQADWLEPGSDAAYEKGGDFKADPPPPGVDPETRKVAQEDIERVRRLYGLSRPEFDREA
ncbi:T6SS effector phospholipase Tle3 domain-containing protein [Burkholderia ubonensis]|uniref:T6SS effector phospholipase Tle3 domain-containing protein n=1 Tax=Burkholderia ubonensis TaxID=101571 RepID=UPI001E537E03|nr:DUF3274 domain-containing protein [Burkholderia ubonensis]